MRRFSMLKGLVIVAYTTHSVLTGALGSELYIPSLISGSGVSKPERLPFEQYAVRHPESKKAVLEAHRRHSSKDSVHEDPTGHKRKKSKDEDGSPSSVVTDQNIFEPDWSECHSSSITEVSPGVLLAVWFAGTEENSPDVAILSARYEEGVWKLPEEVVPPFERGSKACGKAIGVRCKGFNSTWNPVVMTHPSGEVLLFYKVGNSPSEWTGLIKRSLDGGITWGEPELLPEGVAGPSKNKVLILPNGRLLAPASTEAVGPPNPTGGRERIWKCWVDESLDGGQTWARRGPIPFDGNIIQPVFYVGRDGNVRMLARGATELTPDGKKADTYRDPANRKHVIHPGKKYMIAAVADANGENWSKGYPISLPCPNSGLDAVKLADGRLLAAYNDEWDTDEARAAVCSRFRCRLAVAASPDDGATWRRVAVLADGKGAVEHSYPAIIQTEDGYVHITYTDERKSIRHVVLDPAKF
uniref:Sialidase domain-containing protein n=2 Tax=Pyramimonas obovata TaxID=1411642 RepID=A0A7S0QYY0_9CHLO|mmetsp:Transcript_18564/g.40636  ORF Transcript_18564/g.40636 Transcript_18564/m.40636 type:complete len:470 (+) Transcript_18564:360-1769(+)